MTSGIGRRFTIEPKPERPAAGRFNRPDRPPVSNGADNSLAKKTDSSAISGIRLFAGNALVLSRKFGCSRSHAATELAKQNLTFTVTERGLEPQAFVRVVFRCPLGIFVQTVRGDEENGTVKEVSSRHQFFQFDREVGQSLMIRPRASFEEAILDIENHGIFIQHWFDEARARVSLQVCVTEAWEVICEAHSAAHGHAAAPVVLDESSSEFLAAFMRASEHYLDREEFDLLKAQAWVLLKGSHPR